MGIKNFDNAMDTLNEIIDFKKRLPGCFQLYPILRAI